MDYEDRFKAIYALLRSHDYPSALRHCERKEIAKAPLAKALKALALGANGVCLGRAARWGLAAFGQAGAQRIIEMLQQELVQTAAAAGCAKLSDINRSKIKVNFV